MTVMAARSQVKAGPRPGPVKAAGVRGAMPPPRVPSRPRIRRVSLTPKRAAAAKSMRRLAQQVQAVHPDMTAHEHVRDAARVLEAGDEEGAQRHLRAAAFALTPQSLHRNGVHDDIGHISARQAVHGVHRHLLLVKDIQDVAARNAAAIARDSYGDDSSSPPMPQPPVHADPNAGYGPGALAQRPAARQPGGDRALNAPDRTNSGGSDPAVADPVGRQPKGSKQFATWDDAARAVEFAVASVTWDDLASVVELSPRTATLEATPAPIGKPGGPGLYGIAGNKHADYFEQVRNGLMKRGVPEGRAHAMTWGILRRWARGGGAVHPEVRAAAAKAVAEEEAKAKAARAVHGHAVTWDDVGGQIELAAAPRGWDGVALELATVTALAGQPPQQGQQQPSAAKSANASAQPRVGAGSPAGGQFAVSGGGGGQQQAKGKQAPKGKQPPARPAHPSAAQQKAAKKKALLAAARAYRARASGILHQIQALQAIVAKAQKSTGKTVKASSNVTKTSAPAKKTAAAAKAGTPAASAAASAKAAAKAAGKPPTASQARKQLPALRSQYRQLMAQAAQVSAQAAKL